jgi:predicted RNA-binding Zn-ribbon protein involved in translation (DUF1610 family)
MTNKDNTRNSTYQHWICPNCGEVESAYWGQCLKCGAVLNPIKEKSNKDA